MVTDTERELISCCVENYADDQSRLVYADWLADAERELEAELVRKQVELHRLQCVSPYSDQELKKRPKAASSLSKEVKKLAKGISKQYAINENLVGFVFRRGLIDRLSIGSVDQCKTEEQLSYIETCLQKFAFAREVNVSEGTFYGHGELFDKFLKLLQKLPFLHKLSIDDEEISDAAVKHLSKCKRLMHVSWLGAGDEKLDKVRAGIVRRFRKLPQEEQVQTRLLVIPSLWDGELMASEDSFNPNMDLHQSFLYDSDSVFFEGIEEIEMLRASDSRFTKVALESFSKLPNLKTLELNRSDVCDFSPLVKAKKLESVCIDDRNVDPDEKSILRLVSKNESLRKILICPYNDELREAILKIRPDMKMDF